MAGGGLLYGIGLKVLTGAKAFASEHLESLLVCIYHYARLSQMGFLDKSSRNTKLKLIVVIFNWSVGCDE